MAKKASAKFISASDLDSDGDETLGLDGFASLDVFYDCVDWQDPPGCGRAAGINDQSGPEFHSVPRTPTDPALDTARTRSKQETTCRKNNR